MTAPHGDQIVEGYLARLHAALLVADPGAGREIEADVRAHISEARSALSSETDADVLNLLDRLGEPEALAAADGANAVPDPTGARHETLPPGSGKGARGAVIVLLVGAVIVLPFGVAATPVGVAALLAGLLTARASRRWADRDVNYAGLLAITVAVGVVGVAAGLDSLFAVQGNTWVLVALVVAWSVALLTCAGFLQWSAARRGRGELV